MKTKIEWTNETWNPITGCTKVSEGCKHCYAESVAKRFWGKQSYCELGVGRRPRKFTDVIYHEDRLNIPLKWKKPRKIFVCSMGDLFHKDVPFDFDRVPIGFALSVMNIIRQCPQHIFQILTKRPKRMKLFMESFVGSNPNPELNIPPNWNNLWLGVSVEDQKTADERIPLLLQTPAAVRWISAEPLLSGIDLQNIDTPDDIIDSLNGNAKEKNNFKVNAYWKSHTLDWVVVGGESGPKARPMHPDWVRSIRDQCKAAGVPFFFKQWGAFIPAYDAGGRCVESGFYNKPMGDNWVNHSYRFKDGMPVVKVGKKKAGNLLDGKQYQEYPKKREGANNG